MKLCQSNIFTQGGCLPRHPHPRKQTSPRKQTPPGSRHPLWKQTPPEADTPPGSRPPPEADTPPQKQTPPEADTPRSRHTPQKQTPPGSRHPPPPGIRSMSGRYASYWNAFLLILMRCDLGLGGGFDNSLKVTDVPSDRLNSHG